MEFVIISARKRPLQSSKAASHKYREYKKFLPRWDIPLDPAGEASKFWQWIMHVHREKLMAKYEGTKLEIPDSWKGVTEMEASNILRTYFPSLA